MSTVTTSTPVSTARTDVRSLARSAPVRVLLLTLLAAVAVAVYLFTDLPTRWEYALGLRTRTVAGFAVAAAAVGVATVLFQTVTANRILTPGIMGFDAVFLAIQVVTAFAVGPALLVGAPPLASWLVELVLMTGAVVALYWWLFQHRRLDLHVIVLAGLVLGVLFRSVTGFLQRLLDPDTFAIVQDLTFASFTSVDEELLLPTAVLVGLAIASLWPVRRSLDVLGLGETTAISLGVDHRRVVMHAVVAVAVMVAASTALVGPVTFFGLLVSRTPPTPWSATATPSASPRPAGPACSPSSSVSSCSTGCSASAPRLPVVIEFVGGLFFLLLVLTGRAR